MLSEHTRHLLHHYGWIVQLVGSVAMAWILGRQARLGQPQRVAGWHHATYSMGMKAFAVLLAGFMTAALAFNGLRIFASDVWVASVILLLFAGSWWLLHEVFIAQLRWNDERFELARYPFPTQVLYFREIVGVRFHSITESVTVIAANGKRAWIPIGNRSGMAAFLGQLRTAPPEADD